MCLSTVYKVKGQEKEKICEYISNIEASDGEFICTDIMGIRTRIEGRLRSMDLVKNEILIEE